MILELLAQEGPLPTKAISRRCRIPRSSTHHLLGEMRARDFVSYKPRERTWCLGPKTIAFTPDLPTLPKILVVLESFDRTRVTLSVDDLVDLTGIRKTRLESMLAVMEAQGLVIGDENGAYVLGYRVVRLASRVEHVERLRTIARPFLFYLRDRTGETANLLIQDGNEAVYVDQVESRRALRISGWTGKTIPIAGTASGAALNEGNGVHVVTGSVDPGVTSVACRIPGTDRPPAAVSVLGPSARLMGPALTLACGAVEEAAATISAALDVGRSRLAAPVSEAPEA